MHACARAHTHTHTHSHTSPWMTSVESGVYLTLPTERAAQKKPYVAQTGPRPMGYRAVCTRAPASCTELAFVTRAPHEKPSFRALYLIRAVYLGASHSTVVAAFPSVILHPLCSSLSSLSFMKSLERDDNNAKEGLRIRNRKS